MMSRLRGRLRRSETSPPIRRSETTSTRLGLENRSEVDKNAPPTFVPKIITGKYTNEEDNEHVDFVSRHDPLARFIVRGVSEMIYDDWFQYVDEDGEEIPKNKKIQRELKRLNAKKVFVDCLAAMREFKDGAYLYTGKNKILQEEEGGKIATLRCFTPLNTSIHEYDAFGDPKTMKIDIVVGKGNTKTGQTLFLPASDFIFWKADDSVLTAIWDLLVYYRYIFFSMCFFDMKIGAGLFVGIAEEGFGDEEEAKWATKFTKISTTRAMILDKSEMSDIKWVGPTGSVTDFVEHLDTCVKFISVPVGLPHELLMGAAAGAVTGSETNIKLGDEFERKIKNAVEPFMDQVVDRMGWDVGEAAYDWLIKTALTEEDEAKILQTRFQAFATALPFLTIDEVRKLAGYPPAPDGTGNMLAGDKAAINVDIREKENEQEPNNEGGTQI